LNRDDAVQEGFEILDVNEIRVMAGIAELKNQCPGDWSPNKKELDDLMEELATTLGDMAETAGVSVPDTTAWV